MAFLWTGLGFIIGFNTGIVLLLAALYVAEVAADIDVEVNNTPNDYYSELN